jgi:hypothetical protein
MTYLRRVVMALLCAWVLWERGQDLGGGLVIAKWQPMEAHETKQACDRELTKRRGVSVSRSPLWSLSCLPDTVTPK